MRGCEYGAISGKELKKNVGGEDEWTMVSN
jgi:hypothetical protein